MQESSTRKNNCKEKRSRAARHCNKKTFARRKFVLSSDNTAVLMRSEVVAAVGRMWVFFAAAAVLFSWFATQHFRSLLLLYSQRICSLTTINLITSFDVHIPLNCSSTAANNFYSPRLRFTSKIFKTIECYSIKMLPMQLFHLNTRIPSFANKTNQPIIN